MTRRTDTPFDNPKKLWERLTYPSLRWAFEEGHKLGYAEGHREGVQDSLGVVQDAWPPPWKPDPEAFETVTDSVKRADS